MRKVFVHPVSALVLVLLLSVGIQPTSPVAEASDDPALAATVSNSVGDGVQEGPCWLTCYDNDGMCPRNFHWATKKGDVNRWDGGDHPRACYWARCGPPPFGKHAPCTPGEALGALDEAVGRGQADRLVEILADNPTVVLNPERRAIQVWSTCDDGELSAHLPLPSGLFDALVLAQDQDALE